MRGWHRHDPGGPPSGWKGGQGLQRPEPGSDPLHCPSGPVLLQPEPTTPFLCQQVVVGVHPAPVPPPTPAQEKALPAVSTVNPWCGPA